MPQNNSNALNPEQNTQTETEILNDLIQEVAELGDREDLSDYEITIKGILANIRNSEKIQEEYNKLRATPFDKGMAQ